MKPIVILVHGMGVHTDESFKDKVVGAANTALHRYERYKDEKFEDHVDIRPVSYDYIFEKIRKEFKESNAPIGKFLKDHPDIKAAPSIIVKAEEMQAKLGDDNFMTTHVLDVILYLTNVGEWVRTKVAEKIVGIINKDLAAPVHFIAHSLGTSVLHDSLSKLMRSDSTDDPPELDPDVVKFKSIWMFANVSRLLSNYSRQANPYTSIVKPGDSGCTRMFFNIRHVLDPLTIPMMFDPQPSDSWVKPYAYKNDYFKIVTKSVSRKNTHDIAGYIEDPTVSIPFLRFMMNFKGTKEEIAEGNKQFKSIDGEYEKIEKKFKHIDSVSDLKDFLGLLKDFRD